MDIQALATENGLDILKNEVFDRVKRFVLLGASTKDDEMLAALIQDRKTTYESIHAYKIFEEAIDIAYYDDLGQLTFELPLPYEPDFNRYIHGIGLLGTGDQDEIILVSITPTPKIMKFSGVGGTFTYKINVSGEADTLVYDNKNAVSPAYFETRLKAMRVAINNAAGAHSIPTYYPGEFKDFFEQTPPDGWHERNGAVLTNAEEDFPELWAELQKPENAWKLKTETDWQALSAAAAAASPIAMGGVAYFVLDADAKTIRLPDTRMDFLRHSTLNGADEAIGDWQADQYQGHSHLAQAVDISGSGGTFPNTGGTLVRTFVSDDAGLQSAGYGTPRVGLETRPRNIAVLGCVCIEPAKAQRNEATTTTPGAVYLASGVDDTRVNSVPNVAMAAGLGMPSDRYDDLAAVASNDYIITPADGYIHWEVEGVTTNMVIELNLESTDNLAAPLVAVAVFNGNNRRIALLPVRVGAKVYYQYEGGTVLVNRFVYAQGAN